MDIEKMSANKIFWVLAFLLFDNGLASEIKPPISAVAEFSLIHRHSPHFSKNNLSTIGFPPNRFERIKQLIHSDNARQQTISYRLGLRRKAIEVPRSGNLIDIPMRSAADTGTGQYLVSFRVGSPPQKFVLIADTGSDLTWMICNYKCNDCPKAGLHPARVFQADLSPSFKSIPCTSTVCKTDLVRSFALPKCPTPMTPCAYEYGYADGTRVSGFFANETVTVGLDNGGEMRLEDVMIGCSRTLDGNFRDVDGVMGLGYNKHSFGVQVANLFGNKFSYCLVDHLSPSNLVNYLSFGSPAVMPEKMQYTKLILGVLNPYYAVNVSGISVGGKMLQIQSAVWDALGDGGVIVDSGSSLTYLVDPVYLAVMDSFKAPLMELNKVNLKVGPMEFCFNQTGFVESMVPKLVIHFADGVQFVPPVKSYVIDAAEGVKCLGFASTGWPGTTVIGNILQQNHFWEFDLGRSMLGFAPSTCNMFKSKSKAQM